jgi:hypothetical protein
MTDTQKMIDFGLNTLERNPRQNNELDAEPVESERPFSSDCQASQARKRMYATTSPPEQIVDVRSLADQHAQPERGDDGVNRQTCGNAGGCQQTRASSPIEPESGQIRRIQPRSKFEKQEP